MGRGGSQRILGFLTEFGPFPIWVLEDTLLA